MPVATVKSHEFDVQITPGKVWLAILVLCLLLPLAARTADRLSGGGRIASPGAVFRELTVIGEPGVGGGGARGIVLAPGGQTTILTDTANTSGRVRIGPTPTTGSTATLDYRMYVGGNLFVTGCIYLNGNPRCDWAELP